MTNQGSIQGNVSSKVYTQEELNKCLYQIVDQRKPNGNYAFYLYNLYIECYNKSKDLPDYITQHLFNEVIQLFIDLKQQDRICANKVNNIILNVVFNDSKDRSSTELIGKLIQVYNKSKSIKISLDTGIAFSEIQKSIANTDLSVCYENNQLILMKSNTILHLNSENVNSSSAALERNDELTKEDLTITKCLQVEDGLMEEVVDTICLTSTWHNDCNCGII